MTGWQPNSAVRFRARVLLIAILAFSAQLLIHPVTHGLDSSQEFCVVCSTAPDDVAVPQSIAIAFDGPLNSGQHTQAANEPLTASPFPSAIPRAPPLSA